MPCRVLSRPVIMETVGGAVCEDTDAQLASNTPSRASRSMVGVVFFFFF